MKMYLRLLILVLALSALMLPGLGGKRSTVKADGENPCDPTFMIIKICQLRGGTFNFSTCQCEFK
ncbi:MAG TPA: hypothetical protein VEZ90_04770 [Blastocatellia bacterium]|nr:hypothetical protein [Blastocatellia bacterium]